MIGREKKLILTAGKCRNVNTIYNIVWTSFSHLVNLNLFEKISHELRENVILDVYFYEFS